MKYKSLPFYLIILSLFIFITAPNLWSDGMFMDGLLYADISKNLANNIGSFWNLKLTETLYPSFHEHPPLAFGLQSIFFRIFGDGIWIERLYSFLSFIIIAILLVKLWKKIAPNEYKEFAFIPLFVLLSVPVITWSAANNMLENTMTIFTLTSTIYLVKSLEKKRYLMLFIAAFFLLLAVLTKGLVALYLLSFFFWLMIFDKNFNWRNFIVSSTLYFVFFIVILGVLFLLVPESKESLLAYINKQVVGSLENVVTVESRFFIVKRLFNELIPAFIIGGIFLISYRKLNIVKKKWIGVLLFLGLSGVFPIMISMKQSGFYILTTYPFFAIGLSLIFISNAKALFDKIRLNAIKWVQISSYILVVSSIVFSVTQFNKTSRDKEILEDVYKLSEIIPEGEIVSINKSFYTNWGMHGYFYRAKNISLDSNKKHRFHITKKGSKQNLVSYKKEDIQLNNYDLYIKND
jgi:4-amino-4-deoxy-L-arabinose transferase-like glycosyltransferase